MGLFGLTFQKQEPRERPCKYQEQTQHDVDRLAKNQEGIIDKFDDIEKRLQDGNKVHAEFRQKTGYMERDFVKLGTTVDSIDRKVDEILLKPSKKWEKTSDNVLNYIVIAILGAVVGMIFLKAGLPI